MNSRNLITPLSRYRNGFLPRFLLLLMAFQGICLNAQLQIDTTLTPAEYLNYIAPPGNSFNNVHFYGDSQAIGYFSGADSTLGFTSGLILSSGPAANADDSSNFGAFIENGLSDIPELTSMVPTACFSPVNDGLILEFEFTPQSTPISFRYVFASEEYPEYVCSIFNDVFAFLISGPGISGTQNLAIVPGSGNPVTVSYINNGVVGQNGEVSNDPCVLSNNEYFSEFLPEGLSFDGYTKVLTAIADVIPCSTYTLRLMIADYCDSGFDSAVFLEGGSGSFGPQMPFMTRDTENDDGLTYEGCVASTINFSRSIPEPFDFVIPFTISGTATNGVDYALLPSFATILAGETTTSLSLEAQADNINEGSESVTLEYETICGTREATFLISDASLVNVAPGNVIICENDGPITISADITGGTSPLYFSWSEGSTTASALVNPDSTTTYVLTVTDVCGNSDTASITVTVEMNLVAPVIVLNGEGNLFCTTAGISYLWEMNGQPIIDFDGQTLPPQGIGNYAVTVQSENGCISQQSEIFIYTPSGINKVEESDWDVFPNPAENNLTVIFKPGFKINALKIYDLTGRLVASFPVNGSEKLDLSVNFTPGMYWIEGGMTKKMLIIN